jgi:hypothetical protein
VRKLAALCVTAAAAFGLSACGLQACEVRTTPATEVTHNSALLHGLGHCPERRLSGRLWYEYRQVGTSAWLVAGPPRSFACTARQPTAAMPSERISGLVPQTAYEFRAVVALDPPGGPSAWVDGAGSVGGRNYTRFTTRPPPPVAPKSAFAFRDSIGVVTHIVYYDTAYGDWARITDRLVELGVRHLREGVYANPSWTGWNERFYQAVERAASKGIRFNYGFSGDNFGTVDQRLNVIAGRLSGTAASVEGWNEYDLFVGGDNWPTRLGAHQRELFWKVKLHPSPEVRRLPVIGPSFGTNDGPGKYAAANPSSLAYWPWADFGNVHPYAGADTPNPAHLLSELVRGTKASGNKPFFATEAGFHTAMALPPGLAFPPVSEQAQAVYVLRTFLEHFADGIQRTFLYELIDEKPDPSGAQFEQHFGLLRNDFTPKPAFSALKNLLAVIGTQPPGGLQPIRMAVTGALADLRHLTLQRGDGTYLVLLWRLARVWDRDRRRPLTVAPVRLTVSLPDASRVTQINPVTSTDERQLAVQAGRVGLDLAGDPVVLHVTN